MFDWRAARKLATRSVTAIAIALGLLSGILGGVTYLDDALEFSLDVSRTYSPQGPGEIANSSSGMRVQNGFIELNRGRNLVTEVPGHFVTFPTEDPWYYRFVAIRGWQGPGGSLFSVEVAAWIPFIVLFVFPVVALMLRARRKHVWAATGRCSSCGYDLTGNTSGVCPECGAAVTRT